jgi:CRP-like cAMP-binding protein
VVVDARPVDSSSSVQETNDPSGLSLEGAREGLREVLARHERVFAAGAPIYQAGQQGETLYVVRHGEVLLSRPGPAGSVTLGCVGPGGAFGEYGATHGGERGGAAVATCETRLLELDRATFEALCLDAPIIALRVVRGIAARLDDAEAALAANGLEQRAAPLLRVLLARAERTAEGARIPGTLRSLAKEAELPMLDTHQALQQWIDRRLLLLVDDVLLAPDLEALARVLPH